MKYEVTIIAENEQEIKEILRRAREAKAKRQTFPFKVEGSMPAENVDGLISACEKILMSAVKVASFTFR